MRSRTLTAALLLALAVPAMARADGVVPDAVPDAPLFGAQAARGGGLITQSIAPVAPTPKVVDGNIDDWTGEISRYGGTAIYSHGEYVYQDYLGDNWGADDGQDAARAQYTDAANDLEPRTYRVEALSQALGEQFNVDEELDSNVNENFGTDLSCGETVCAVAHYGNVDNNAVRRETDIEEVRVAADADNVYFLLRTSGMTTDRTALLLVLGYEADTCWDHHTSDCIVTPGGLSEPASCAVLVAGSSVRWASGPYCEATFKEVATEPNGSTNAIEVRADRAMVETQSGSPLMLSVGTCYLDQAGTGCQTVRSGDAQSDLLNLAFRGRSAPSLGSQAGEPARIWMDRNQAFELRQGWIQSSRTRVDLSLLSAGYTESYEPRPGYYERIYVSDSPTNNESENSGSYFQGQFQQYGVYLPSTYRESSGTQYPATWWTHYRGGHAHDAAAWVPGLLRQFGEQKGNIMIFPSARGTSSWYMWRGHEDFLEVWEDAMTTFPIDPDRVVMTGYSMGGFASWFLPTVYPDRFSAASPQEGPPAIGLFAGVGPNPSDPSNGQNDFDPQSTLTYNILENARNVPYVVYHGTDDELVPITGIYAMQKKFVEMGYRNRVYALDGNEHYTTAVLDMWTEAADYVNRFRRDPNPSHVTYRTWPAIEYAASTHPKNPTTNPNLHYRFNKAYWVSDLDVRGVTYPLDTKPVLDKSGFIDVVSHGRGEDVNLLLPEAGAGVQGTPYEMTGLSWLRNGRTPAANRFEATLQGLSTATLDVARMGISTDGSASATITTDGPTTLVLAGRWPANTTVAGAGASLTTTALTLTFTEAGTCTVYIESLH